MGFVSLDWTLIMQLGNTLILFLLLKKFLFTPVKAMMDSREKELTDAYALADTMQAQAEGLKAEYAASLSGAKDEADGIVREAYKRAQDQSNQILQEARGKAALVASKAEQEIAQEKKKAINEIKDEISDMAIQIATKVVEKDITAQDHEKLIQEFIDGVGDAEWKA